MSMTGPAGLALVIGILSLGCTLVCAARIWLRRGSDTSPQTPMGHLRAIETDLCHALMGVAMAGMLIPPLKLSDGVWSTRLWLAAWAAITGWFVYRLVAARSSRRAAFHHLSGHVLLSVAMVFMLGVSSVTPAMPSMAAPMTGMPNSAMPSGDSAMPAGNSAMPSGNTGAGVTMAGLGGPTAWVDLLLTVALLGLAIVSVRRASRPRPATAVAVSGGATASQVLLDVRLIAWVDVAMALAMAYMLVMMLT
jgi:hypothetical protein